MIYKPDGREGRLAYCYVTKPFTCMGSGVCDDSNPHWWSSEAHDCTDVRNLVTGRAFNNLKHRFWDELNEDSRRVNDQLKIESFLNKEMYYDNLNESAFQRGGIYHATFGKKDFEIQCDSSEWMVGFVTS